MKRYDFIGFDSNQIEDPRGDFVEYDDAQRVAKRLARTGMEGCATDADRARIAQAIREAIERGRGILNRDVVADLLRVVES